MGTPARTQKKKPRRTAKKPQGRKPRPALEHNADAMNVFAMHVARANALASFSTRAKSIAAKEIVHRLEIYFQRSITDPDEAIGRFIRGGAATLRAMPVDLNRSRLFSRDDISFAAGDFDGVTTIKALGSIIIAAYIAAGWHVS